MDETRTVKTGVLVLGGGGAGARAAIAANDAGADVLLVTKHFLGRSGCAPKLVYMSAVGPWSADGDSADLAIADLIEAGGDLGDPKLLQILMDESEARLKDLESYGARFDKSGGKYMLSQLAGHSRPRTLTFGPRKLGSSMMSALTREVRRRGIDVMEQAMLTKVFVDEGRAVGAGVFDYFHGEFLAVEADAIVLAAGGYGAIYSPSTVTKEDTGDGLALALEAGAELTGMENLVFLPGEHRAWGSQKGWGETPHFLNTRGERFMLRYNPEGAEFATKEVLIHAIAQEVLEGRGTEHGGVYSDLSHLPWKNPSVKADMADLLEHGKRFGFDPRTDPVEMWPLAHTPTGGVRVDEYGESRIPRLFAAGANAASMYGFGRIEGFTSLITQVFGRRAGEAAAKEGPSNGSVPVAAVEQERRRVFSFLGAKGSPPSKVLDRLHGTMYNHGWILKDEAGLQEGLKEVTELRAIPLAVTSDSRALNHEWVQALELSNMLLLAELVLRGSLMRKESRGSFFRLDYPNTDKENWRAHIVFGAENGEIKADVENVEPSEGRRGL